MEAVLYVAAAVLSLIGLSTLIKGIVFALFCTKRKAEFYHIVCLNNENAEMILRDAVEMLQWNSACNAKALIAVDTGLDDISHEMCRIICRDYNIKLCTAQQLPEMLISEQNRE